MFDDKFTESIQANYEGALPSGGEGSSLEQSVVELNFDDGCCIFQETSIANEEADIYIWEAADAGTEVDRIPSFILGKGGDFLQLIVPSKDLTPSFSVKGPDTVITLEINENQAEKPHQIILENIDLTVLGATDEAIAEKMIGQGNLEIVSQAQI